MAQHRVIYTPTSAGHLNITCTTCGPLGNFATEAHADEHARSHIYYNYQEGE